MFKHFLVLIIFLCIFEIRANEPEGTTSAVPDGAAFSVSSITGTTRTSRRLKCQWDTAATLCGAHNGGPAHIANVDIGNKASEVLDLAELSPGDPVADVWGGAGKNKGTHQADPKTWTTDGIIIGSDVNKVTSTSDIRGIEFIADKADFPTPGKVYKIVGLGRVKSDGKTQTISHGAYIMKSEKDKEWAYLFVYTGTAGEGKIATALIQHHATSSFDMANSDLADHGKEDNDNDQNSRKIFGRIFPNDKIATVIHPTTHKFEIYVNGQLRYRSTTKAIYHTGLRPVAAFHEHPTYDTVHGAEFIRTSQVKFDADVKPNRLGGSPKFYALMAALRSHYSEDDVALENVNNAEKGIATYNYIGKKKKKKCRRFVKNTHAVSFLEMQSSKGKLQVNKEQRGLRMSTGSCQPEFMDFTNDKWNGMILKNTFSSSQDFYQKYNGGLKAQVTFEIDGANMDIISDPNGKNPFLAKFHCVNSNSLCSPTTSGLTFHVKASIGGTTKTWYKVVAKNCGVEWHDCKSTSKFPCDTRRRRLLSKRRGGC